MNTLLTIFLIGISLSMDTFSLSLCYGTLNIPKSKCIALSLVVGIFHFFMPLLGLTVGNMIIGKIIIDGKYIVLIILSLIGIDMILSSFKDEEKKVLTSFAGIILFAFSVSIDSFSTGLGLNLITNNILSAVIIFSLTSSIFTYLGVKLGTKLNEKFGKISNIIGGTVLILIGICFLF